MPNVNDMGFIETLQDSAQRHQQVESAETTWIDGLRAEYKRVSEAAAEIYSYAAHWPLDPHTAAKLARMQRHIRNLKHEIDLY